MMVWRDFTQRYRGSYLGILWAVFNPLFVLVIYTFVFSFVFRARWNPTTENTPSGEFTIILFAGLIPYYFFSEVLSRAPTLLHVYSNYVKKVVFPLEILVLVICGTAFLISIIHVVIISFGSVILLHTLYPTILLLPLIYLPLVLLTLGIGWFLASLGVYIRDISHVITLLIQIMLFVSPIFYPVTSVPESFQVFFRFNPLTMIVGGFRNLILWGQLPDLGDWVIWTVISIIAAFLGYFWFISTKKDFADIL